MEALLQDPETTGVSVEILPDLFVPADLARRVQMLVVGLAASLAALALDRGLIDLGAPVRAATAPRPVASAAPSPPPADPREPETCAHFESLKAMLPSATLTLDAEAMRPEAPRGAPPRARKARRRE